MGKMKREQLSDVQLGIVSSSDLINKNFRLDEIMLEQCDANSISERHGIFTILAGECRYAQVTVLHSG